MKRLFAAVFAVALGLALTSAASAADSVKESVKDTGETVKDKTKSTTETVKDKTKDAAETVKDKTKEATEKVKEKTVEVKDRMTNGGKHADVMAMQQALRDKGHDPGALDGHMGPKTRAALKNYQQAEGLKVTGRLDADTRTRLGMPTHTSRADRFSSPSASPSALPRPSTDPTTTTMPPAAGPARTDIDKSSANQPTTPPQKATSEQQKPGS